MRVSAIDFCHWLDKFMAGRKKTPAQDIFCENESPHTLTRKVSQAAKDIFCDNEYHDFLQLSLLIYTLNHIDHVSNVKNMLLRQVELLHGEILKNSLHHSGERNIQGS